MKVNSLSLEQIRKWLDNHQRRLRMGDDIQTVTAIAEMSGISRQTIYALLRDQRTEFGESAQIRLSRVISQISSEPNYQHTKMARIDLTGTSPKIRFGL